MIYDYLYIAWVWCLAHPEIAIPIVIYLAWNIIPRTPPKNRFLFALWSVAERAMLLSWERWGGTVKSLGIVSPDPEVWADEALTHKEGKP